MSCNAVRAFYAALDAVLPTSMVHNHLTRKGDLLFAGGKSFKLANNVYVVGFGKAVSGMCRAVQDIIGDHIVRGQLNVPVGSMDVLTKTGKWSLLPLDDGCISVYEGAANNLPDNSSVIATKNILEMVSSLTDKDLIITLISGGGSALLCAPLESISLQEKLWVTNAIAKKGSTISELNMIRKKMSRVKGGGLAEAAFPAKVVSLILSDIIGDPISLIASGPTVKDDSSAIDCRKILEKYSILNQIPPSVSASLSCKSKNPVAPGLWDNVHNIIVGSNTHAVSAAENSLKKLGYQTFVLSRRIDGEAREVGIFLMKLGIAIAKQMESHEIADRTLKKLMHINEEWSWIEDMPSALLEEPNTNCQKISIIGAGETTVTVSGNGRGGRNQEMCLAAMITLFKKVDEIPNNMKLTFLSAGTDGQDGPTDAAGAVIDNIELQVLKNVSQLQQAEDAMKKNDSYTFFNKFEKNILKTGLTGTNVMDIQIITIEKQSS